jgi:hypothetical protein
VRPELAALDVGDAPERWEALGFSVSEGTCDLGGVRLRLGVDGSGIRGWALVGIPPGTTSIDGLATELADGTTPPTATKQANGAVGVDHVVVATGDFDRTAAALEAVGMTLRRVVDRPDGRRMGFRRLGPAILELVEAEQPAPARFWGLVVVVEDLDALAERLGRRLGSVRDAVQPGRRIATLRESAGLGEAVAFMSPCGSSV